MSEKFSYTLIKEDEGLYIREVLRRRLLFSSRLKTKIKYHGAVLLNDVPVKMNAKGIEGDILTVLLPEETNYFEPENIPLDVPYEDSEVLVVNKPAGLIVHPTKNFLSGTLANALAWRIKERGEDWKIRFVNRLDMNTSGLVIIAKNAHVQDFLSREMEENRVDKEYLALVYGAVECESGTVDAPLGKDPDHKARRMVRPDGAASITHYKVLRRFAAASYEDNDKDLGGSPLRGSYTLLSLRLETGRTHQIRVHMTHIGHPIVGDDLYAPICGFEPPYPMARQALHAARLSFTSPGRGERINVTAALPQDFLNMLESLGMKEDEINGLYIR